MNDPRRTHKSERTALEQTLRDESAHARRKSRDVKHDYLLGYNQGLAGAYKYASILVRNKQILREVEAESSAKNMLRGMEALAESNSTK